MNTFYVSFFLELVLLAYVVLSILPALNFDSYKPTFKEIKLLEDFERVE